MNIFRAISSLLRFDRTNWKALALCFFAAAIFWIFNAFNKKHATNLRFPLKFEYNEEKFIPVEPLPNYLMLNVSGNGWDLFRKRLGLKIASISVPLERPAETKKIVASSLGPLVASQVGTLELNFIVNDTLRLKIDPKVFRRIRLAANVSEVAFKKNFGRIGPIDIQPDSVELQGPKSIVDALPDSVVLTVRASRVSENFRASVEIIESQRDHISRNPPVADVTFRVGPLEEVASQIKLHIPKMPWGMEAKIDSIGCLFSIPQQEHDHFLLDRKKLQATFLPGEVNKGEMRNFVPIITGIPSYAKLIQADSVSVKKY